MNLYAFNLLDKLQQAQVLWELGVHIGERKDEEHKILLYQIGEFYVEVYYHSAHNVISRFRSFSSVAQLQPYLEGMPIEL